MADLKERIARSLGNIQAWGRNAKILVSTELFWGIPMAWVWFYQAVFMRNLGMDEVFIGFSITLPLVLQMFLPMLGGYLADKIGRKRVFLLFDSGWIGSMAIWFIAKEPWQIILAMLLQGLSATIFGVWETLLVEDTELPYRAGIYSLIQFIYIFGGLLTPVAGALISLYGVDQGCRYMFLIALIAITTAFIIRLIYLKESETERAILSPKENDSTGPKGYIETSRMIIKHRRLLIPFALTIIGSLVYPLINTYKPLYLSDPRALALDESIISVIPMASAIPSLVALSLITPKLRHTRIRKALLVGYACGILGAITLITAPKGALILAVLSSILDSARSVATFSILRVLLVNAIDEVNPYARAKIMSLVTTCSAFASWPAPVIGGYLYTISPIWPFVLAALLLVVSLCLMLKI